MNHEGLDVSPNPTNNLHSASHLQADFLQWGRYSFKFGPTSIKLESLYRNKELFPL